MVSILAAAPKDALGALRALRLDLSQPMAGNANERRRMKAHIWASCIGALMLWAEAVQSDIVEGAPNCPWLHHDENASWAEYLSGLYDFHEERRQNPDSVKLGDGSTLSLSFPHPLTIRIPQNVTFSIYFTRTVGTLTKGHCYTGVRVQDKGLWIISGYNNTQRKNVIDERIGGNPEDYKMNVWGVIMNFNEAGEVFDSRNGKLVAQLFCHLGSECR